jgi:putative hemolysin
MRVSGVLSRPTRLLSTILVGNTIVNVCAASLGFNLAERMVPTHGEAVSIPVMTLLLLIFGEVGPKRIAVFWPERVAAFYAPVLPGVIGLLRPLCLMVEGVTHRLAPFFQARGRTLTEAELESVVDLSGEEGIIDAEESAMVKSIIGLEDLKASDVMTPRVDIVGIDLNEATATYLDTVRRAHVRFLPLYRDQLDHIEGILDVRQYLLDPDHILGRARINPYYVPESCPLDKLLTQFQETRNRVAVVVDEYGGTAGIVTRGDILEEITGEIDSERDQHVPMLEEKGLGQWLADGNISLEALNEKAGLALAAEGVNRLAGWVAAQAERLPRPGETVEAQGCRATVLHMRRNRITLVQLARVVEPRP